MKKKTLVKVLPALLIAPVLALCITGFALASEANDESVFDKILCLVKNSFREQIEPKSIDSIVDCYNAINASNDDTTFDCGDYNYSIVSEVDKTIKVKGFSQSKLIELIMLQGTTSLNVPVTATNPTNQETYKVVAIQSGALASFANITSGKITDVTINGYEKTDSGSIIGGWFTSIESTAFQNYYEGQSGSVYFGGSLKSVVIPDCCTSIGPSAFMNDAALNNLYVQTSNFDSTIQAFEIKAGFPSSLTRIGNKAFMDCSSLSFSDANYILTIPSNVNSLEYTAFKHCSQLKHLVIESQILSGIDGAEASLEDKGGGAFEDCYNLETVDFSNAKGLTNFGVYAFRNCYSLKHLELPSSTQILSKQSFACCYSLDNISFNEGLNQIGEYAFANLTTNPNDVDGGTPSVVEYLYLPESLEKIHTGAFLNSTRLKEIVVGMENAHDADIYKYSFGNCPSLISVSFIWNMPRLLDYDTFKDDQTYGKCASTGALDFRVRPLIADSQFGGRIENFWLKPFWDEYRLDEILPSGSYICLLAAFDDTTHGHDLEMYLEKTYNSKNSGVHEYLFDNQTIASWNVGLQNEVKYRAGISIPDTLTLRNDHTADEKMIQTITEAGNSKTIEFVWDSTPITQTIINSEGERVTIIRPEDDGVLNIGNNCIQTGDPSKQAPEGRNVTLNVGFRILHEGSYDKFNKSPLITGHFIPSERLSDTNVTGPVQFNSISNAYEEGPVGRCPLDYTEPERQSANLLQSNSATWPTYDITAFSNKSGCKLNFNMPQSTTPSSETEKTLDFVVFDNNIAWNSCVYNSGKLDMENCKFTNNKGAWGNRKDQYATTDPWGGSCIFNNGSPAYKGKTDIEGGATLKHCVMEGNSSIVRGGSIYNVGDITLNDCGIKASKSTGDCINEDGTKTGQKCAHPNYAFAGAIYSNIGGKGYEGLMGNLIFEGSWVEESTAYAYVGGIYTRNGAHLEMKDIQLDDGTTSVCHYSDNLEGNLGKNPIEEPMAEEDKCYSDIGLGPELNTNKLVPFIMTNSSGGGMGGDRTSYVRAMCDLVPGQENIICTTTGLSSTDGWAINKITAGEDKWELNVDAEGRLVFKPKTSSTNKQSFIQKIQTGFEANKETIKEKLNDNAEFLQKEAYIR